MGGDAVPRFVILDRKMCVERMWALRLFGGVCVLAASPSPLACDCV